MDPDDVEVEFGVGVVGERLGLSNCSVTFAKVVGSARLKDCSKNTGGTVSSGGIVRVGVVMMDVRRDGVVAVGVRSEAMDGRGVVFSSPLSWELE